MSDSDRVAASIQEKLMADFHEQARRESGEAILHGEGAPKPSGLRSTATRQTVAESFRATAERLEREAHVHTSQAKEQRRQAASYRDMADRWDADHAI